MCVCVTELKTDPEHEDIGKKTVCVDEDSPADMVLAQRNELSHWHTQMKLKMKLGKKQFYINVLCILIEFSPRTLLTYIVQNKTVINFVQR